MKSALWFAAFCVMASTALADDVQYDIRVDGITCPFCVATSEQALKKIDGVHDVGSDLETGTIFVCADSKVVFTDAQLKQMFLEKGFTYRSFEKKSQCAISETDHTHHSKSTN
jgi:copper chaperone